MKSKQEPTGLRGMPFALAKKHFRTAGRVKSVRPHLALRLSESEGRSPEVDVCAACLNRLTKGQTRRYHFEFPIHESVADSHM